SAAPALLIAGGLIGFGLVMFATFGRKMDNKFIVLAYAAAEGVFLGALSLVFTGEMFGMSGGSALIGQAILGTFGVFFGMLVVYKTGAIRVTPRLTRMIVGALIGVVVLMLGNLVASFFMDGGFGLRDGGPIAIIFSLVCIGIAAFSFLLDFDQADQLIRAQAPEKAAWGVALGLTITLVWLYVEILSLLSYCQND
ncbi:MAG: Bax inhibitor-1/YccA family protein, partial [Rhodococcus sp. (in: high G+C Gram-positive bacteria)]